MATEVLPSKEKSTEKKPKVVRPWTVILFNDDIHSFDEVILQVQKATGCSLLEATRITLVAHCEGKAVAYTGAFADCHKVAGILREIGLMVQIEG
jgi:ATP-dependent Clp protease adapter protein ClpS